MTISRISTTIQPPARIAETRAFVDAMTALLKASIAAAFAACAAVIAAYLAARAVLCSQNRCSCSPGLQFAVTSVVRLRCILFSALF